MKNLSSFTHPHVFHKPVWLPRFSGTQKEQVYSKLVTTAVRQDLQGDMTDITHYYMTLKDLENHEWYLYTHTLVFKCLRSEKNILKGINPFIQQICIIVVKSHSKDYVYIYI